MLLCSCECELRIALLQLVRLFWCKISWCNCTVQEACVRTGLAVTLNHHFWSSQHSCERYQISFQRIVTTQSDQRVTHRRSNVREDNSKQSQTSHFPSSSAPSLTGSRMLEYGGSAWHEDCFVCHSCEKPIGAEAFIPDKNNYYCVPCYEGRFAPQCSHCKKVNQAWDTARWSALMLNWILLKNSNSRAQADIFKCLFYPAISPTPKIFNLQANIKKQQTLTFQNPEPETVQSSVLKLFATSILLVSLLYDLNVINCLSFVHIQIAWKVWKQCKKIELKGLTGEEVMNSGASWKCLRVEDCIQSQLTMVISDKMKFLFCFLSKLSELFYNVMETLLISFIYTETQTLSRETQKKKPPDNSFVPNVARCN